MLLVSINTHRKVLNKLLWLVSFSPAVYIVISFILNNMTANPFEFLIQQTGHWAMVFFLLSYAITPLRRWLRFWASYRRWSFGKRLADWNFLIFNRRLLGLCCFYYASAHLNIYLYYELSFDWTEFYFEITERIFISLGLISWLLLMILALTSPDMMQKRLKKNWRRIHKLVYLIVPIVLTHLILETKIMQWYLWVYLALLATLSIHRIAVQYLPSLKNIADTGMLAVRKRQ